MYLQPLPDMDGPGEKKTNGEEDGSPFVQCIEPQASLR